jgi:hypothetical protein
VVRRRQPADGIGADRPLGLGPPAAVRRHRPPLVPHGFHKSRVTAPIRPDGETNRSTVHQRKHVSRPVGWTLTRRNVANAAGDGTAGDAQCGCGPTEMAVGASFARRSRAENGPTLPRNGDSRITHASRPARSGDDRSVISLSPRPSVTMLARGTAAKVVALGARAKSVRARTMRKSVGVGVSVGAVVLVCADDDGAVGWSWCVTHPPTTTKARTVAIRTARHLNIPSTGGMRSRTRGARAARSGPRASPSRRRRPRPRGRRLWRARPSRDPRR